MTDLIFSTLLILGERCVMLDIAGVLRSSNCVGGGLGTFMCESRGEFLSNNKTVKAFALKFHVRSFMLY